VKKYLLSTLLVIPGDGMLPDPTSHAQIIFPATMETTSDYNWAPLSSLDGEEGVQLAQIYPAQPTPDGEEGVQLAQIYPAQPTPDGVSPFTLDFQTTVNYPWSHHQTS